jgi:hypothetical protein
MFTVIDNIQPPTPRGENQQNEASATDNGGFISAVMGVLMIPIHIVIVPLKFLKFLFILLLFVPLWFSSDAWQKTG